MNTVKELLLKECDYPLSGEVMDRFLESAEELHLKRNEILIMSGKVDANIYVVKEGIMRYSYMNGLREVTYAFFAARHHDHLDVLLLFPPAHVLPDRSLLRIDRGQDNPAAVRHADSAVATTFARWALQMAHGQLFFFEMKNSVINGDAKERFLSLVKNRPEIMEKVPLKFVASYLGITQSYLSRLKKAVMKP